MWHWKRSVIQKVTNCNGKKHTHNKKNTKNRNQTIRKSTKVVDVTNNIKKLKSTGHTGSEIEKWNKTFIVASKKLGRQYRRRKYEIVAIARKTWKQQFKMETAGRGLCQR